MTSSPDQKPGRVAPVGTSVFTAVLIAALTAAPVAARATLPEWLQHVIGASSVESALYRSMHLPAADTLYPRPPKEAQVELARLIATGPDDADLYRLRARTDEQALDETAAEADWKRYATHAKDRPAATEALADFYHRRLMVPQELAALGVVAAAPSPASEIYLNPTQQRSWRAYARLIALANDQALPPAQTGATLAAFLDRYPDQPSVYALNLKFFIAQKDFRAAEALIARYRRRFPQENVFPVRAAAVIAEAHGDANAALAIYDRAFEPLWQPGLIQSYFELLDRTQQQRAFVTDARARLAAHPDGPEALNAVARIFYYDQQAGRLDAAQRTLDTFRIAREARKGAWTAIDLYTLATLAEVTHSYVESARYNYALASTDGSLPDGEPAAQSGIAGLVHTLLEAPDQPLALGAQNLTLYRDIGTLDQGPGYWNGILSLWLNDSGVQSAYEAENGKAQSYFHRAKAAELLADLDQRFPAAPQRPALHAELLRAVSQYGEPASVVAEGKRFLASFPVAPERLEVADLMADAYARQEDTVSEFALYDAQLAELAARTAGMPLSAAGPVVSEPNPQPSDGDEGSVAVTLFDSTGTYHDESAINTLPDDSNTPTKTPQSGLTPPPARRSLPEAVAYSRELDRYLGRLVATNHLPHALSVLRVQVDRNPSDPLLYEKLATFLQQNNLSAQEERTYELAFQHFQQPNWYGKLGRLYLREKKADAFAALTRKVTDIFSGTDIDRYFSRVNPAQPIGPQLALQLNLYAAKRFPHDLVFTRNLLAAYEAPATGDAAAYEALIRRVWWESPELEDVFVTWLSRTGKLEAERAALAPAMENNPAALRELAYINIFTSHYEEATPQLAVVATAYPADPDIGDTAVSLYRSAAYLDPTRTSTQKAAALESNLLNAAPDNLERLATLGDLYAEATANGGEDLASAAPFWHRMTGLHPGSSQGYLLSATIFWDYFQFDDALAQVQAARTRFHAPSLFAYEAGAIEENRHNMPAAIAEYTNGAVHPVDNARKQDLVFGVIDNFFKPPSDAADSNLWATAQSFVGTPQSAARLLTLAKRKSTAALVDQATAGAIAAEPVNPAALTLRADVLSAQHTAPELTSLLASLFDQALARAATTAQAEAVGTLAQNRSLTLNLTPVYERALARQAELTPDPVQQIELRYTLARSLESHKDAAGSARIMDAVYRANPRVLGVVRATTDFYARIDQPAKSIATLLEAAKAATPDLKRDFTLEAANRANEAGDPTQARSLAAALLVETPYDARVIAVVSSSYARAHDDAGLQQFFFARLDAARADTTATREERRQNIALLRRGLIPALTRAHDDEGAVAQYIALLSAFPEDTVTAQEAALYARRHAREAQLLDFLRTTVRQSPKDSRFAALLGQVETTFGDLRAAEAAWSQAIAIRQDRVDFYTARVNLEMLLSQQDARQFDRAASDFARLYLISYHDPSWMVRLAELRARQQRSEDAVKALKVAYLDGHAETAKDLFAVADHLASCNLFPQAQTFAERGVALAGADLLAMEPEASYPPKPSGAVVYARIMTRLGKADTALLRLRDIRRQVETSASSPSVLAAELAREQVSQEDAAAFRNNFAENRRHRAEAEVKTAVDAIGAAIQTFYTPEQKLAFAETLDTLYAGSTDGDPALAIDAATAAGLADREAAWRRQLMVSGPTGAEGNGNLEAFSVLETRRLAFPELARALEAYADRATPTAAAALREQAAKAYRAAGDPVNEMRLERSLILRTHSDLRDRYLDLLLRRDRSALTALAASKDKSLADAAVNYAVAHATEAQALAAVARRGQALPAVWRPASASLVETYFASSQTTQANVDNFTQSLASDLTVGDRIGHPALPARQLTGDNFFVYASRFGIFLATVPRNPALPDPEDFLPAELEASPSAPASYRELGRSYAEAGNPEAATVEYRHVLELAPATSDTAAIEDELACILYRAGLPAGRRDQALEHWRNALANLLRMQQHAIYPEQFFNSFKTILDHLGQRRLAAELEPEIDPILSGYLAKNGNYRSNELLKAVYTAAATPQQGIAQVLRLATSAPDPLGVLDDLHNQTWLSDEAAEAILRREVELAAAGPQDASTFRQQLPAAYRLKLIDLYLSGNHVAWAAETLKAIPIEKDNFSAQVDGIVIATRLNRLLPLLAGFRANPETSPRDNDLAAALTQLQRKTLAYDPDPSAIRPLAEFLFEHKQQDGELIATDYLQLAQLRLDTQDVASARELLQQLALQPAFFSDSSGVASAGSPNAMEPADGKAWINIEAAAALLEANHRPAEALPFLESLTQLEPWNASYRLRLGEAQRDSGAKEKAEANLLAAAKDASAPYDTRVQAARDLAAYADAGDLGSGELALIAHPTAPPAARQPYFNAARIALAQVATTSQHDRDALLREAIAIAPGDIASDRNRLRLLLAQPASADASATLAILRSMLNQPAHDDSQAATEDEASDSPRPFSMPDSTGLPPIAATLDRPTQIRLATQLASASERDGDLAAAVAYAELALTLDREGPADPALQHRRDELKTLLQREQRNAARRPILHGALAQTNQVRPRLSASALAKEDAQ